MGVQPPPAIAVPGLRLGPISTYTSGPGTYILDSFVCASIAGPVVIKDNTDPKQKTKRLLTVARSPTLQNKTNNGPRPQTSTSSSSNTTNDKKPRKDKQLKFNSLPSVDSIVLGRVTRVQKRQATISILVVVPDNDETDKHTEPNMRTILSSAPTNTTAGADGGSNNSADDLRFQALIRKEDVRAVEKDRVVMEDMFRVGDIVRASVISLGDQSFYYCSTARNELGVVMARSEGGNMMFPVSWKEMRDPETGLGELRKVAKPF